MAIDDATWAWTAAAIARLHVLWGEGHSTAEIGRRMSVSKNAVIGKAHRLGLWRRPNPIERVRPTPHEPAPPPQVALDPASIPTSEAAQLLKPPRRPAGAPARLAPAAPRESAPPRPCCWPLGEPGRAGFRFCDASAEPGQPYCAEHRARAYLGSLQESDLHVRRVCPA